MSRLLDQELPEIDKLDRLEQLVTTTHTLQTEILSDAQPAEHPQYVKQFTEASRACTEAVSSYGPWSISIAARTPSINCGMRSRIFSARSSKPCKCRIPMKFTARQLSTEAMGLRLQVMDDISRLQAAYKAYVTEAERNNLTLGEELRQVSLGFAAVCAWSRPCWCWAASALFLVPLRELVMVTDKIAGGQLNEEADESRGDEFGQLARAFNQMVRALRSRIRRGR